FTFAHSPKHLGLYQHFGFWPRFLTPLLSHPVSGDTSAHGSWQKLSQLNAHERDRAIKECVEIGDEIHEGLDVRCEVGSVAAQRLGDTVLVGDDRITAFAICHTGAHTEAGGGACYIKFAAVRTGAGARTFDRLLDACEAFAANSRAERLELGVST